MSKIADLAEVEEALVEAGPHVHAPAMNVVREVVEVKEAKAFGLRIAFAGPGEFGVIGRALGAVAIDEIEQAAADALDGGNIEREESARRVGRLCAQGERTLIGRPRVDHAERHRGRTGAVLANEVRGIGARLLVDEVVHVALPVEAHIPVAVPGDEREAHRAEQLVQRSGVGMGVFDELEAVGSHRIVCVDLRSGGIVRKGAHGDLRFVVLAGRRLDHGVHARCVRNSLAGGASAHGSCRPGPADARLGREGRGLGRR